MLVTSPPPPHPIPLHPSVLLQPCPAARPAACHLHRPKACLIICCLGPAVRPVVCECSLWAHLSTQQEQDGPCSREHCLSVSVMMSHWKSNERPGLNACLQKRRRPSGKERQAVPSGLLGGKEGRGGEGVRGLLNAYQELRKPPYMWQQPPNSKNSVPTTSSLAGDPSHQKVLVQGWPLTADSLQRLEHPD